MTDTARPLASDVIEILLADGWHAVMPGTFKIINTPALIGETPGFTCQPHAQERLSGRVSSILAVRTRVKQ